MKKVFTGLDRLVSPDITKTIGGNIGYLCHAPSVDRNLTHGIDILKKTFGDRFKKIFSPQHGLFGDLQDNMIESGHFFHPYYKLPVYSLYSETRQPTDEMLEGLDHIIIDLQDVGTRVYTYIWTMVLAMVAAGQNDVEVIILDRPNPINGLEIEGNMLDPNFSSFVGLYPIPMRHGLTTAELAQMAQSWGIQCNLRIIEMGNWSRMMYFDQTGLPWVIPSPNLATLDASLVYPGTVIFEGTNLSEGRGTTRSLELIGHPKIEPFSFVDSMKNVFAKCQLKGFVLRPFIFKPTFHKHKDLDCGGLQIHVTNRKAFQPWKVSQHLCREFRHHLGDHFDWKSPPYEYEFKIMPYDILNGTNTLRLWVDNNGTHDELLSMEATAEFQDLRDEFLIYRD